MQEPNQMQPESRPDQDDGKADGEMLTSKEIKESWTADEGWYQNPNTKLWREAGQ
jgi:hypothetical protein